MTSSPNRRLLDVGLNGRHMVQVDQADFSNSAFYVQRARATGITVINRDKLRNLSIVPGCPAAAPGGLSADEMRRFVRAVTSSTRVRAIDFTELDVQRDSGDQRPVQLAVHLVLEALADVQRRQA